MSELQFTKRDMSSWTVYFLNGKTRDKLLEEIIKTYMQEDKKFETSSQFYKDISEKFVQFGFDNNESSIKNKITSKFDKSDPIFKFVEVSQKVSNNNKKRKLKLDNVETSNIPIDKYDDWADEKIGVTLKEIIPIPTEKFTKDLLGPENYKEILELVKFLLYANYKIEKSDNYISKAYDEYVLNSKSDNLTIANFDEGFVEDLLLASRFYNSHSKLLASEPISHLFKGLKLSYFDPKFQRSLVVTIDDIAVQGVTIWLPNKDKKLVKISNLKQLRSYFVENDYVSCKFQHYPRFYQARITTDHGNGTYSIEFIDVPDSPDRGNIAHNVKEQDIDLDSFQAKEKPRSEWDNIEIDVINSYLQAHQSFIRAVDSDINIILPKISSELVENFFFRSDAEIITKVKDLVSENETQSCATSSTTKSLNSKHLKESVPINIRVDLSLSAEHDQVIPTLLVLVKELVVYMKSGYDCSVIIFSKEETENVLEGFNRTLENYLARLKEYGIDPINKNIDISSSQIFGLKISNICSYIYNRLINYYRSSKKSMR